MPPPYEQRKPTGAFVRDGVLDRDAVVDALRKWLSAVMPKTGLNLRCKIQTAQTAPVDGDEFEKPDIVVLFDGADLGLLLDRGAELMLALEYLALRSLRLDPPYFDRIRFDGGGFRANRIAEIKASARAAADRAIESGQPVRMNHMAARERRIVHLALKEIPGIRTASEGVGEERQVVIFPADKQ